jgi:hypothetical protein
MMREAMIVLVMMAAMAGASGQTVPIPPRWTAGEQVAFILDDTSLSHRLLTTRAFFHADNNVLPLKLGNEKRLPPLRFGGDRAYFVAYRFKELSVTYRRWTLRYGHGKADFYEGNGDAAQLYLDAMANAINPTGTYDVVASLNRTRLHRWSLDYAAPFRLNGRRGYFIVTLHWLRLHRLQRGTLTGRMNFGQFRGDLRLLTTRGLPDEETQSNGIAMDVAVVIPIGQGWQLGIWSENLFSRLWQRTLQDITAQVATNVVEPDADGFLHAVPLLQGRVDRRSLTAVAKRRWALALSAPQGRNDWLLLAQRDADGTQASLGYAWAMGKGRRVWLMRSLTRERWQLGVSLPRWQLFLSTDKFNSASAKRTSLCLQGSAPF